MDIRRLSAGDYPAIANIHTSLSIVWPQQPRTPEAWAEADRNRNPKRVYQRLVAVQDGEVVGFGSYGQSSLDYHPQRFYVNVEVSPEHQRQGVGAALYEKVMAELQPFDPLVLRADAFTNLPQGFSFLQKRGFYEAWRETPVHVHIPSFDPSPYADLEGRLACAGIGIQTLRELESDPDRDRKTYNLYWDVVEDVPQEDTRIERQGFDEWAQWGLNDPTVLHDACFVATQGGEYVGLSEWGRDPDSDVLWGGLLGVRRAHRGLGVALAMQLRAIAYARAHGYPVLRTCTAVQNVPMQSMFNKLGFARDPEWQQCQKDIGG